MAAVGDGGRGGDDPTRRNLELFKGFCQQSSYWAVGGLACFIKYKAMSDILKRGMVRGGPAFVFVACYGLLNYKGYKYATNQIKENAKEAYKRSKDFD